MKAISVKFKGWTETKPARYIASDGDGNKAVASLSADVAALLLCQKMGWKGILQRASLNARTDDVYVWVNPEDQIVVE